MRKVISALLLLLMMISVTANFSTIVIAASESDLVFNINDDGKSYSVTDCNESASGKLIIPEKYNNKPITNIGKYAFSFCENLTSIVIPDSVNSIEASAFHECVKLSSVEIGNGVKFIGDKAFMWCERLQSIVIPDNVISIGSGIFCHCYKLKSVTIGDGVTSISEHAFLECRDLTSVIIGKGVTSIGNEAFICCESLSVITIPYGVSSIGDSAFVDTGIRSIEIPDSVNFIGSNALGYKISKEKVKDFKIQGRKNTAAEMYARENGFIFIEIEDEHKHTLTDWIIDTDATCTVAGSKHNECTTCGETVETAVIPAKGHTEVKDKAVAATCTATGLTEGSHCSVCNSIIKVQAVVEAKGHSYGDWIVTVAPSCIGNGSRYKSCSSCGNVVTETIPANGHSYSTEWTIDVAPTCTEAGSKSHHCTVCDAKTDVTAIKATGHTEVIDEAVAAICTATGLTEGSHCSVCNAVIKAQTVVEAKGHTKSDWIIDKNATCTENGSKHIECTVCGENLETVEILATGHTETVDVAVEATCTATGLTEGSHCSVCNAVIKAQENVDAKGHTASDWKTDKKATVNKAGSKHKECTVCGETLETATIKQLKCSKPSLKKVENTADGVKITWGKVSGADKYNVYRKTGSSGKYSKIGTTSKTYYTDKKASSGKKYYYYVKAVNEAGSSSASSSLSKYYLADTTLSTPKSTKSGITLKWKKVTGADGYLVYRKTGSGSYSKIATVKGNSKVTYTDKSAKKGKTYTYKIKAYKSKTYSAYSNTKKIKDKY